MVALAQPLAFTRVEVTETGVELEEAAGTRITPLEGIHYSTTIPETIAPGTGVLAYYVHGALPDVDDDTEVDDDIAAEEITGVIGGDSAHLFRVNKRHDGDRVFWSRRRTGLSAAC